MMRRINSVFIALLALLAGGGIESRAAEPASAPPAPRRPNIIFIMADDLGYGDLGCYGQKKIKTPHIDRLAAEGMRFTQFYAGSAVCAPTRCVLLTGLHSGHSYIRNNGEIKGAEGQMPIPPGTTTIATLLKKEGYATACIGKWGLGGPGSTGEPNKHGFDHFFGYLCQRVAHNLYPTHLWRNTDKVVLDGNTPGNLVGKHYAHDLMAEEALGWVRQNKDKPFFLYLAWHLPHLALQAPVDSMEPYRKAFGPEEPYDGKKGYLKHETPRAALAGMISRMDLGTGRLMALLKELKLDDNTIVFFTSDNGGTWELGGVDPKFFQNNGDLRAFKGQLYEGGIRVPMIARWPGKIAAGKTTEQVGAHWDVLPTLMEIAGAKDRTPSGLDGLSLTPTLFGGQQKQHDYLYWELGRQQAVRMGDVKAVRKGPKQKTEVFNLAVDVSETKDLAAERPDLVKKAEELFVTARTESKEFPALSNDK